MKNCWLVRPLPNGKNRMEMFLDKGIIAIGYPVGRSFLGLSYNEIRDVLGERSEGLGNVNLFTNMMSVGDVIVVPDPNKRDVYIGVIDGEYDYDMNLEDEGYPHVREVTWLFQKKPLFRNALPDELRTSMRYPGTISDVTKHLETIQHLISTDGTETTPDTSTSLSSIEKEAIDVLRALLQSENEDIRIKAADIILSHKNSRQ